MARLLSPTDFGLVAMVLVVIGVAELFRDFGLSSAAIQAPTLSPAQRTNLLWLNASMGLVLSVVVAAAAPLIAWSYGRDELTAITLTLAPTFFISGLMAQYRVHLVRGLRFHALAAVDVVGTFLALLVGIVLAWQDLGYWALVIQQLSSGVITLAILAPVCGWLPGRFRRHSKTLPMVRFGSKLMASSLLTYTAQNVDSLVVGQAFGAADLGVYNRALQTVRTPLRQAQGPFTTVTLPVLSQLHDDDARFLDVIRRSQIAMSYLVLGAVAVIVAASSDFIQLVLGDQWTAAGDLMVFVAIGSGMAAAASPAGWIFVARGLGTQLVRYTLFTTAIAVVAVLVGSAFGVAGVAAGYAAAVTLTWPVTLFWVGRAARLDTTTIQLAGLRAVLVAGTAAGTGRVVRNAVQAGPPLASLAAAAATVALVAGAAALLPPVRRDYAVLLHTVGQLRRRRVPVSTSGSS